MAFNHKMCIELVVKLVVFCMLLIATGLLGSGYVNDINVKYMFSMNDTYACSLWWVLPPHLHGSTG